MKVITKYEAFDGSEFISEAKCAEHESSCNEIDLIMSALPKKPDSCDFSNGSGYLQHEEDITLNVRNKFLEFAKRYTTHKWIQESIDKGFEIDPSWAGRMISECAPSYISRQWYRFQCMDKQLREWGQPYYASHPEAATQTQLN